MVDRRSLIANCLQGGIVLAVLCFLPSVVFGSSPPSQDSGQTSGKNDPFLVCEQGKRQSPVNIVTLEHENMHHDLVFRYKPSTMHIVHDGHTFKGLSESNSLVLLDGHSYQFL